jgi:nucleoside 2-deoxyribosyltransferase
MLDKKIYCAGPLFNDSERNEMGKIASSLEDAGFKVFLPHRDGFEYAVLSESFKQMEIPEEQVRIILNKAIYTLDVYQVLDSDGLVFNINGRVPDEGAAVEAGIAWSSGKKIVIFKCDTRSLINGNDNPLILGLSDFNMVNKIPDIPELFNSLFAMEEVNEHKIIDNSKLKDLYAKGSEIFSLAQNGLKNIDLCKLLIKILELDYVHKV